MRRQKHKNNEREEIEKEKNTDTESNPIAIAGSHGGLEEFKHNSCWPLVLK